MPGIIPVLATPIKNGTVSQADLAKLTEKLLTNQIAGLWVLGTGSEDMMLDYEERILVAETVCSLVARQTPVYLGCSFSSMTETLRFVNDSRIRRLSFESFHYIPQLSVGSDQLIKIQYNKIKHACNHKLYAYTSDNYTRPIEPSLVSQMKREQIIDGVKFSTSNGVWLTDAARLNSSDFPVISAVVKTIKSARALGIELTTSVEANIFSAILGLVDWNNDSSKELLQFEMALDQYPDTDAKKHNFFRVAEIKYILYRLGIISSFEMAGYFVTVSQDDQKKLDTFVSKFENILG